MQIKRVSDCSLSEAVEAWNRGFEGYFVPIHTNINQFVMRMAMEGLSPNLSIIAFDEGNPIGIVMNGIRVIDGKKMAWNGGTGVALSYRHQGIGRELISQTLRIYEEEGVGLAILEAISENSKAIALYEKFGYAIVDRICNLFLNEEPNFFQIDKSPYRIQRGLARDVVTVPFYAKAIPWQTMWQSVQQEGQSILVFDQEEAVLGYCLFKYGWNGEGKLAGIYLYQCEVKPQCENKEEIIRLLLQEVFEQKAGTKQIINFSLSKKEQMAVFAELGFSKGVEQVSMEKRLY